MPKALLNTYAEIVAEFDSPWRLVDPPPSRSWRWAKYDYKNCGQWVTAWGWYLPGKRTQKLLKQGKLRKLKEVPFDMAPCRKAKRLTTGDKNATHTVTI